jgi:hypothetical protein
MSSIQHRVAEARDRLRAAGIQPAEADLSARLLAEHLLGWDTARLFTSGGELEPAGFAGDFDVLVSRRAAREPLHYIVGHREFWGLDFEVTPAVLIPRADTELIVEVAPTFPSPTGPIIAAKRAPGADVWRWRSPTRGRTRASRRRRSRKPPRNRPAQRRAAPRSRSDYVRSGRPLAPVNDMCDYRREPSLRRRTKPSRLQPEVREHEPDVAFWRSRLHLIERLIDQPGASARRRVRRLRVRVWSDEDIERMVQPPLARLIGSARSTRIAARNGRRQT